MSLATCESVARRGIAEVGVHSAYASIEKGLKQVWRSMIQDCENGNGF